MSTIGGVAFRLFDRLPAVGDKISSDEGFEFIAREVQGLRISRIQVRKLIASGRYREDEALEQSGSEAQETAGGQDADDSSEKRKES